jgi:hypothetical protein
MVSRRLSPFQKSLDRLTRADAADDQRGKRDQGQEHRCLVDEARYPRNRIGSVIDLPAPIGKLGLFRGTERLRRGLSGKRDLVGVGNKASFDNQSGALQGIARHHHPRTQ